MPPEVAKYLYDVQKACTLLAEFSQGKSLDQYLADELLQSGVERQFIIVGEALMQGCKVDPDLRNSIAAVRQIIGFRNVLVHGYATIDHEVVWGVLENDIPTLRQEVDKLLASFDS